jgi:hypothetical protein
MTRRRSMMIMKDTPDFQVLAFKFQGIISAARRRVKRRLSLADDDFVSVFQAIDYSRVMQH